MMTLKNLFRKPEEPEEPAQLPEVIQGQIASLNKEGYGFIITKQLPFEQIYFHWRSLKQETKRFPELKEGMTLEFSPRKSPRGWRAIKVKVVE